MSATFDPFEPPGTIEPDAVDDPYPYLAAARRKGPVQTEWPLPRDVTATPPDEPSFCVLGYDEVVAVLRDDETPRPPGGRTISLPVGSETRQEAERSASRSSRNHREAAGLSVATMSPIWRLELCALGVRMDSGAITALILSWALSASRSSHAGLPLLGRSATCKCVCWEIWTLRASSVSAQLTRLSVLARREFLVSVVRWRWVGAICGDLDRAPWSAARAAARLQGAGV